LELLGNENLLITDLSVNSNEISRREWKQLVFAGALKKLEKFRTAPTKNQLSRDPNILLPILYRAGTRIYSNFEPVTKNGASPYGELSNDELADLTGYKKSLFIEIGRSCIALVLFDIMMETSKASNLIKELPPGKLTLTSQRSLRKAAKECLTNNHEEFKKCMFYKDVAEWLFPSAF